MKWVQWEQMMNKWRHRGRKYKRWWANGCHLKSQEEKDARIKSRLNKRVNCEIVENTSNPCNSNPSSSSKVVWSMVGHLRRATIHRLVRLLEFKPVSRPVFTFGLLGVCPSAWSHPVIFISEILVFAISIYNSWYAYHTYVYPFGLCRFTYNCCVLLFIKNMSHFLPKMHTESENTVSPIPI